MVAILPAAAQLDPHGGTGAVIVSAAEEVTQGHCSCSRGFGITTASKADGGMVLGSGLAGFLRFSDAGILLDTNQPKSWLTGGAICVLVATVSVKQRYSLHRAFVAAAQHHPGQRLADVACPRHKTMAASHQRDTGFAGLLT